MPQAKTLLAATDFSTPARHALERAAQLAAAHSDSRLTLAHAISRSALDHLHRLFSQDADALEAKLLEQAQCSLSDLAQHLAASHGCAIDTVLKQGSALATLVELAEERHADLLVMGARGEHFMRERLLGSTTERVLRTTRRPLRAQARDAAHEAMHAFISQLRVPASRLSRAFVHGAPTPHILEQEQMMDADLIVMGKHGRSALEELLLGSVTQHVLAYSGCDIFIAGHPV